MPPAGPAISGPPWLGRSAAALQVVPESSDVEYFTALSRVHTLHRWPVESWATEAYRAPSLPGMSTDPPLGT